MNRHIFRAVILAFLVLGVAATVASADPKPSAPQRPAPALPAASAGASTLMPGQMQAPLSPVGTGFTYQGRLVVSGSLANGQYDFVFTLYDASSAGNQIATPITLTNQTVTSGLFSVSLDFGNTAFQGDARWLGIAVRQTGGGSYTTLSPRVQLGAVPYAMSLMPGATISGSVPYGALTINQNGFGDGLDATAACADCHGVYGNSTGSVGEGVYGTGHFGVVGYGSGSNGYGVSGVNYEGTGVYGFSSASTGYGVYGENNIGTGVYGSGSTGVHGNSSGGVGVQGDGGSGGYGVYGSGSTGLEGHSVSSSGYGVYGTGQFGVYGYSPGGTGMYASSGGTARSAPAFRADNTNTTSGMAAYMTNNSGYATAHFANGGSGQVLYLQANGGDFIDAVNNTESDAKFRVNYSGNVYADGGYFTPAADFAEMLPATPGLEPGDVLVVNADGKLTRSTQGYQSSVVGVYSTKPGVVGGNDGANNSGKVPLAVVGVVPVKATAENGSIHPGDLLTASSMPGHAMKANKATAGTIIGKALSTLESGTGTITVLVTTR